MLKFFANLFRKPVAVEIPQPPLKVLLVSSNTLTLDQWRKDARLVIAAKELARNETFRMMVAVLENSHVRFLAVATTGATQDDRAAHQARSEGYQICLNNLEAMSKTASIFKPPEAKFAPPETHKK